MIYINSIVFNIHLISERFYRARDMKKALIVITLCMILSSFIFNTEAVTDDVDIIKDISSGSPRTKSQSDLLGYWALNEDNGNAVGDCSGNDNHGTLNVGEMDNANSKWVDGVKGSAVAFDGIDDHIEIPSPSLELQSDLSFVYWIKTNLDTANQFIINIGSVTTGGNRYGIWCTIREDDHKLSVILGDGIGTTDDVLKSETDIIDGEWHHIAFTRSDSDWRIYIDGVEDASGQLHSNDIVYHRDFSKRLIGIVCDMTDPFDGVLDEIALYSHQLSAEKIDEIYRNSEPSPVGSWHFDEGHGDVIIDSSGNDNHGTLNVGLRDDVDKKWVEGMKGSALTYDGVNDHIALPEGNNLIGINRDFSISGFITIKNHSMKVQTIISLNYVSVTNVKGNGIKVCVKTDNTISGICYLADDNNGQLFRVDSSRVIGLNEVYHFTVTRKATELRMYINGALDNSASTSTSGIMFTYDYPEHMGNYNSIGADRHQNGNLVHPTNGTIDEIEVYRRALSEEEISCHQHSPPRRLYADWKCDEGEGNGLYDFTCNGMNGILRNTDDNSWAEGIIGTSIRLDGVDDHVEVPGSVGRNMSTEFSIGAWVRRDSIESYNAIMGRIDDISHSGWNLVIRSSDDTHNPNSVYFNFYDTDHNRHLYETGGREDNAGEWNHIVLTYEPGRCAVIYMNGEEMDGGWTLGNATKRISDSPGIALRIGDDRSQNPHEFHGSLDEIRIWDRALTSRDVYEHYMETRPDRPVSMEHELVPINSTSVYIRWNTTDMTTGVVEYGETEEYGTNVTISVPRKEHAVLIGGLKPGTTYHYGISAVSVKDDFIEYGSGTFRTPFCDDGNGGKGGESGRWESGSASGILFWVGFLSLLLMTGIVVTIILGKRT